MIDWSHTALTIGVILGGALTLAGLLIWVERRLLGIWQERYGPNRLGPGGCLQSLADMIKIFTKEDWIPPFADKAVFVITPAIVVITALMSFAVIPIAPSFVVSDLNMGVMFFLAMSSLGSLQCHHRRLGIQQQIRVSRQSSGHRTALEL